MVRHRAHDLVAVGTRQRGHGAAPVGRLGDQAVGDGDDHANRPGGAAAGSVFGGRRAGRPGWALPGPAVAHWAPVSLPRRCEWWSRRESNPRPAPSPAGVVQRSSDLVGAPERPWASCSPAAWAGPRSSRGSEGLHGPVVVVGSYCRCPLRGPARCLPGGRDAVETRSAPWWLHRIGAGVRPTPPAASRMPAPHRPHAIYGLVAAMYLEPPTGANLCRAGLQPAALPPELRRRYRVSASTSPASSSISACISSAVSVSGAQL